MEAVPRLPNVEAVEVVSEEGVLLWMPQAIYATLKGPITLTIVPKSKWSRRARTREEWAEVLCCLSGRTFDRKRQAGELRCQPCGRKWRVHMDDLREMVPTWVRENPEG